VKAAAPPVTFVAETHSAWWRDASTGRGADSTPCGDPGLIHRRRRAGALHFFGNASAFPGHVRSDYTDAMRRLRSLLAALMILWLPLQGIAAVTMPFCVHGLGAPAVHSMPIEALAEAGLQDSQPAAHDATDAHHHRNEHTGTQHGSDPTGTLACNDCSMCHLACSPAVSTSAPTVERAGSESPMHFFPTLPPLFVPELRKPPPVLAVV
jgi:hypothetical protein